MKWLPAGGRKFQTKTPQRSEWELTSAQPITRNMQRAENAAKSLHDPVMNWVGCKTWLECNNIPESNPETDNDSPELLLVVFNVDCSHH